MKFHSRVVFLIGSLIGLFSGLLVFVSLKGRQSETATFLGSSASFEQWLRTENLQRLKKPRVGSVLTAQYLYDRVEISCVVLSSIKRQARAIVGTWGRHCNSLSFVADYEDKYVPVGLRASLEDPFILCKTLHKLVEHHFVANANQWLLLTGDMTFAVVENLRYLVAPLNTSDIHYLGHAVTKSTLPRIALTVNTLRGGIVLSQGAVLALLMAFDPDCSGTTTEKSSLENKIASILLQPNLTVMDTRDANGAARFLARPFEKMLIENNSSPYDSFMTQSVYPPRTGSGCCSPQAVTIYGIDALEMHFYEYLVNRVHIGKPSNLTAPLRSEEMPPVNLDGEFSFLPEEPRNL